VPTFKHPCPYCGKFIDRAVAACPFCGQADPFAPKRCQNCRKIIEDPEWVTCPSCGQSLIAPPPGAAATPGTATAAGAATTPAAAQSAPASAAPASAAAAAQVQAPPPPRPPLYKDPEAPAAPQVAAGKCSGCGAPMPAGARFCTVCGTMAG
jgi:RNA polymerase subunit RPABC4/transcription elongation factor Spt4